MSFFSSFLGDGNSSKKYVNTQNTLIKNTTGLTGGLDDAYKSAARQGAWDPNMQLDQLKRDTAYQTGINAGNAAAAARTMGYRPGDTAPLQQMQAMNNASQLQYADEANRVRTGALQAGYQAASNLANQKANIYGQALNANGNMLGYAEQQDAQHGAMLAGLLGTALPFLGGIGKRSSQGVVGTQTYSPYSPAPYGYSASLDSSSGYSPTNYPYNPGSLYGYSPNDFVRTGRP